MSAQAGRSGLFARKSVADVVRGGDAEGSGPKLQKALGAVSITAIGIGAVIGAGIFVLTGTVAARYAGPAVMISFILAGVACGFVALCYAELAAMIPVSGSTYSYTYATIGEVFAWIVGWDLLLEYAMGAATVAVGWSGYAASLLQSVGLPLPAALAGPPGAAPGNLFNLPAVLIVLVLTALLVLGTRQSARVNNVMVALKLTIVVAFIAVGAFYVQAGHWQPFLPPNKGTFGEFGWSGVLRGASVVFYAYLGFDAVSTSAQEAKSPQRDMPLAILISLVVCTVLYVAVAGVLTGLLPYTELNVPDPIGRGVKAVGLGWFAGLVDFGALTGLTTVILVALYGQSRIAYAMAQDGLLPPVFARLHPRWSTPYWMQILTGLVVAAVAALVPIQVLSELVSVGTLLAFILVCGSVIYLRRVEPETERPFRVPCMPWLPCLGIISCLALVAGLPLVTLLRLAVWQVAGIGIYAWYGRRHARTHAG